MPKTEEIRVGRRTLTISNLDKVYFPKSGFKKGEVLAYYSEIAATILPHLKNRPLTMKRYPDGVTGEPFYEKNAPKHTPDWVKTFPVPRSEGGGDIRYILSNDEATLLWVANLGDIEKHVLLSHVPKLDRPTSLVFDLDPGEGVGIIECGRVALRLKATFESLGLESFVKVSGSKGLHLTVPLNVNVTYQATQPFAKSIAELLQRETPDLVVSDMAKVKRRGKVLIDWSQNSDFKTTVSVYAMRAREGGPFISLPVEWDELTRAVKAAKPDRLFFTPAQAIKRVANVGDLFAPALKLKQKLPAIFTKALAAGPARKLSTWQRKTRNGDTSMSRYAERRDPTQTPEPPPATQKPKGKKGKLRFVIQKHDASRLHYDFRLEMEGVLRSWAVPKGPPMKPREARLAMHVEDHPMAYELFEGTIPKGNYGAGTVMVWDRGEYEDITGDPVAAYRARKMHLVLRGQKLKGEWILLEDKRDDEGRRWLLIKAGEEMRPLSKKADDSSVLSHRTMAQIEKENDREWRSGRPAKTKR